MERAWQMMGLALVAAAFVTADAAQAQTNRPCGMRDKVVERLAEGYGEARVGIGLAAGNAVVEVFASQETGTWTITVTRPNGVTCLMASGQAYEALAEELAAVTDSDA